MCVFAVALNATNYYIITADSFLVLTGRIIVPKMKRFGLSTDIIKVHYSLGLKRTEKMYLSQIRTEINTVK